MSHISTNFDRSGFAADVNVVFPLQRLREKSALRLIGSVARYHYSFMGATDPELMRPATQQIAGLLKADQVDLVLLVPVWPLCTRAVCALAHWLEASGLPTVLIGLVPQHVERMRPPRALLVPFELGRPLGAPRDAGFQGQVLDAALRLAIRSDVPVVEWFESAAPEDTDAEVPWACPVTFPANHPVTDARLVTKVLAEIDLLEVWHERAVNLREGSAVGVSGMDVRAAARFVAGFLEAEWPRPPQGIQLADAFKLAAEDLKLHYYETAVVQPGSSSRDVADWFWEGTHAGNLLKLLSHTLAETEDPLLKIFVTFTLIPEARRVIDWLCGGMECGPTLANHLTILAGIVIRVTDLTSQQFEITEALPD